jgi:hypothetical protein
VLYRLPKKVFDFSDWLGMLWYSIEGDIHEAHGYLYKYGIHAITIKGI